MFALVMTPVIYASVAGSFGMVAYLIIHEICALATQHNHLTSNPKRG